MSNAQLLPVFLAMLAGFAIGLAFCYLRLYTGLSHRERIYLRAFITSLHEGTYDDSGVDE